MQSRFPQSIVTPPAESSPEILSTAKTVLRAQAQSLTYISNMYEQDASVQAQFFLSLQYMHNAILSNGKIVISGMGKSYKIADKLVATMNSLGIHATALHPSDALHGDLGVIKPTDVVVLITSSGNTPELLNILPHIAQGIPLLCLTCTLDSPLALKSTSLLPAVLPKDLTEKSVYGLPAPTTSTTACLAVGDAVCITLAEMLISDLNQRRMNFGKWHPGGAIGQDFSKEQGGKGALRVDAATIRARITPWERVAKIAAGSVSSEASLWRLLASHAWMVYDNKKLIATSTVIAALESTEHGNDAAAYDSVMMTVKGHELTSLVNYLDAGDTVYEQLAATKLALVHGPDGMPTGLYAA
jgi:D-arabinose 5-phosphate isomerase GutQ